MNKHPLRREIIATYITNSMINRMGSGFLTRLRENSGENPPDIARAYSAARALYNARHLWQQIDALDNHISSATQIEMHLESRRLLERASLWLLRNRRPPLDIESAVRQFTGGIAELASGLPELLQSEERSIFEQNRQKLIDAGVPSELAHQVVSLPILYSALDLTEVAAQAELPVNEIAKVYFTLANRLDMNWLRQSIIDLPVQNQWQSRARAALLDNLYDQGRLLTAAVLRLSPDEPSVDKRLNRWLENNRSVVERSLHMLADFRASGQQPDLAMLSVALREAGNLVQGS
jgi:glutamate dehydrogenase